MASKTTSKLKTSFWEAAKAIAHVIQLRSDGVALLSVALALGLTLLLYPWLNPTSTPLFFVAVMVSAWSGGLRAGLMATVLSTLAINYFFIEPYYSLNITNLKTIVQLGVFFVAAVSIGLLNQSRKIALQEARAHLQASQETLSREQVAQCAAQTAKEQLETVLSSIKDGFYVLDLDWRFTFVNDRFCKIARMQREEFLGQGIWDLFANTVNTDFYIQFQQSLAEQLPLQFEYFYESWNLWYENRIYPSSQGLTVFVADITDRKQAESSLQQLSTEIEQQLRRFDAVVSAVPDFIYTFDLSGRFTYINQPLLDLWQKTFAQAVGKNFLELEYPIELAERLQDQIQQVIITRQPLEDETPYTSFQGTRAYEYTFVPLFATDGAVEAVAGITHDITDRKQAELQIQQLNRELTRQANELQTILDVMPVGVAIAGDPQCNFIRSNRFAQTMLGVSPDTNVSATGKQAESLPFRQFRDGQEIPGDQLPMQLAAAQKQEVRDAEIHVVRSDGATFDWWVNAVPLFDEQDAVRGCVAAFMDVTELKQAEAKLHETLTLLNAISDYSLDIIFAKDRAGRLLFVNPAISQHFGKSVDELIGKDEFFFIEDHAAAEAIRANDQYIMQLGVAAVVDEPIIIDGNLRTFRSTKAPLRDANGNILGVVGIGHDITDRKQAEAALAERNQELDSFVHTVSHDLKAPLRAISNLSEWIEDDLEGQLPPENQQQLQLLRTRTKRMESMINSLLVYARAGRQEAPLETFNVAELLDEIIDSLSPPQGFSIEIEPPMPTLNTKRLFLSQVFANLVSNAIKHHTSVDGHLNISVIEQRDFHEFRVRDDGPGIAPEDCAKIFEIFQALKAQDDSENTGVGLAIVKKIVEREKGTIRVESSLGQGATFFFTWPKHHSL